MRGASVIIFLGILVEWGSAQFLNNRPYPTYSLEQMPDTDFTCRDKILGGYYADPETQCQMFHVCVKVAGVGIQDFRFLCPNGTAFDQDHQICADWEDVDCDATTLYYSSDNFDLYRIGSGFESKAVKYGEDEEAFSLQRAETGDVRLNREHQSHRVNQQKDYNYRAKANNQNSNNANRNNNYNTNNNERDIFKGSSSSNFFNNKNGGKETDDDDYDSANVNANQNDDRFQKRKLARKQQQNRRTDYNQDQTQRSSGRPTGFVNNFAGSSYIPTTSRTTTSTTNYNDQYQNDQRARPRNRVNPQYNNAGSFRSNPKNNYEFENANTNSQVPYSSISTPAPFKQTQQYNNNRQPTQYNDYTITTLAPKPNTRSTENYPSPFTPKQYNNNSPPTSYKTTENYPPSVPQQTQTKETENYPTTSVFNNNNRNTQQNVYNTQYEITKTKQSENYQSQQPYKKPTTPYKQTENYPTTFSPKSTQFKSNFPLTYSTTLAPPPRTNTAFISPSQPNTQYNNNKQSTYNQGSPIIKQTSQFTNPSTFQQKQTTQFTQYTPTVPRVTTPYYTSTTPANTRRSNRFDETQYDDGTYSTKYEYDNNAKHGKEEEFLRTAQSTNFASSRNEYLQNNKNVQISTTQRPRPFSVTPNSSKTTDFTKATNNPGPIIQKQSRPTTNVGKSPPPPIPPPKSTPNTGKVQGKNKKTKDASYDYAYYDTNVGSDHEYDLDVDIEKSIKTKAKNQ